MRRARIAGRIVVLAAYLACIVLANWMIRHIGTPIPGGTHLLPVGFGLVAPSGTYAAALTLVARDLVQRTSGRRWGLVVIPAGALISALWDVRLALASGLTFLLSELVDFAIYTILQRRLVLAVATSALTSAAVDSVVFLSLAGIPLALALPGQLLGKAWAVLFSVAALALLPRNTPS